MWKNVWKKWEKFQFSTDSFSIRTERPETVTPTEIFWRGNSHHRLQKASRFSTKSQWRWWLKLDAASIHDFNFPSEAAHRQHRRHHQPPPLHRPLYIFVVLSQACVDDYDNERRLFPFQTPSLSFSTKFNGFANLLFLLLHRNYCIGEKKNLKHQNVLWMRNGGCVNLN